MMETQGQEWICWEQASHTPTSKNLGYIPPHRLAMELCAGLTSCYPLGLRYGYYIIILALGVISLHVLILGTVKPSGD